VPKIEVRYKNLSVTADVQIGSRALPTLINYTRDVFEVNFVFVLLFAISFAYPKNLFRVVACRVS